MEAQELAEQRERQQRARLEARGKVLDWLAKVLRNVKVTLTRRLERHIESYVYIEVSTNVHSIPKYT